MSEYIYTSNGELVSADVLIHYGVPGMKWGHRKAQATERRNARIDRRLGRLETLRKNNKNTYDTMNKEAKSKYYTKSNKYKKKIANNKAAYDNTEIINNYNIARLKAKKDKAYKKTAEYQTARQKYAKKATQDYIYGPAGSIRIEALKNRGYTAKKAKGRVIAEQVLLGATTTAAMFGLAYASSR